MAASVGADVSVRLHPGAAAAAAQVECSLNGDKLTVVSQSYILPPQWLCHDCVKCGTTTTHFTEGCPAAASIAE